MRLTQGIKKCLHFFKYHYYNSFYDFPVEDLDDTINPLIRRQFTPGIINRYSGRCNCGSVNQIRKDIGQVKSGDWDRDHRTRSKMPKQLREAVFQPEFTDTLLFKSFQLRYNEGNNWHETPYYDAVVDAVNQGYYWHDCHSESDVADWFNKYLDDLYTQVLRNGYRTQNELKTYSSPLKELANEVVVDLSRDGEPLLVAGKHRLAIAKIVDINRIPVTIAVYHQKFFSD